MNSPGKFVVIEGIDGSGKTSTIAKAMEMIKNPNYKSLRGFKHEGRWNQLIHSHPKSPLYYADFVMQTRQIRRMKESGYVVLQDRYIQTVDSYQPDNEFLHNKVLRRAITSLFMEPDQYIHFTVDPKVAQKRLVKKSEGQTDGYDAILAADIYKIVARQREYLKVYLGMKCKKYTLDTTDKTVEESAQELIKIISEPTC